MFFRAGKTNKVSVFHVENGKIQSVLLFSVCFGNEEIRVMCVKNQNKKNSEMFLRTGKTNKVSVSHV